MNKSQFKAKLQELVEELPYLAEGDVTESIYHIDDLIIYGDFQDGYRGVDHNVLKFDDITWEQILTYGVLIVPEYKHYISDTVIQLFDELGYKRVPATENHIVGV